MKIIIKTSHLFMLLILSCSSSAFAQSDPVDQLKSFLKKTKTLTASFQQTAFDEVGRPGQSNFGKFYLQRPGQFRWDYQKPFVQQIISTSGKVWFYDADLEQVTIKKMDQSLGSTPALLLSGEVPLDENFVLEQQGQDADLVWIRLLPKNEQSNFKYILIGMENGQLSGMELNDNFGQLTRIYFTELKTNEDIDPMIFKFEAPEGVDIFEE